MPYLSFIIPAYNEAGRIRASLERAIAYFRTQSYSWEILVVDDGSRDETLAVAREFSADVRVIAQARNMGKGAAVRRGMLEATGDFRIFSDADFSTPVYETAKALAKLSAGADVCIGSRVLDISLLKVHQPWYREAMGKIFNFFVQSLLFRGIKDTQCGFKGFTAKAATEIFSLAKIDGFSFDVEALFLASKLGLKIEQVAVEWYNDERSTVNPLTDSTRMFIELLRIRSLHSLSRTAVSRREHT